MAQNVSSFILQRLRGFGVQRIFGYPGDGINGLMGAFDEHGDELEFIQARHEELAAFMACAHAKFTGEVGVCMATSGPGRDPPAQRSLRRQARPPARGRDRRPADADRRSAASYQQEIDLPALFKDVASEYVQQISAPAQVRHVIDRAFRIAQATRTVTCLIVPTDVQEEAVRGPAARARRGLHRRRHHRAARRCRTTPTCAAPPRSSTPARGSRCWSAGRPRRRRGARAGRRPRSARRRQGAARQRRPARRPAVRHRLDRPARAPRRASR